MADLIDMNQMRTELTGDEGRRRSSYPDSLGFLTIGVGRMIDARKGGGLSEDEIDYLLDNDIVRCVNEIRNEPWFLACDTDNRRRAVVNMRFQLDVHLNGFVNTLQAVVEQDWKRAAVCLRKSLWAKQTPKRAARVIAQLENG